MPIAGGRFDGLLGSLTNNFDPARYSSDIANARREVEETLESLAQATPSLYVNPFESIIGFDNPNMTLEDLNRRRGQPASNPQQYDYTGYQDRRDLADYEACAAASGLSVGEERINYWRNLVRIFDVEMRTETNDWRMTILQENFRDAERYLRFAQKEAERQNARIQYNGSWAVQENEMEAKLRKPTDDMALDYRIPEFVWGAYRATPTGGLSCPELFVRKADAEACAREMEEWFGGSANVAKFNIRMNYVPMSAATGSTGTTSSTPTSSGVPLGTLDFVGQDLHTYTTSALPVRNLPLTCRTVMPGETYTCSLGAGHRGPHIRYSGNFAAARNFRTLCPGDDGGALSSDNLDPQVLCDATFLLTESRRVQCRLPIGHRGPHQSRVDSSVFFEDAAFWDYLDASTLMNPEGSAMTPLMLPVGEPWRCGNSYIGRTCNLPHSHTGYHADISFWPTGIKVEAIWANQDRGGGVSSLIQCNASLLGAPQYQCRRQIGHEGRCLTAVGGALYDFDTDNPSRYSCRTQPVNDLTDFDWIRA